MADDKEKNGGTGSGNAVPDDVKKQISDAAVEEFKKTLPKPPEKYDVKLPENAFITTDTLGRATATARELGLANNEQVQKMIEFTNGEAKSLAERLIAEHSPGGAWFQKQQADYLKAALEAPDLGGGSSEKLQAIVARVTALTGKYFSDDARKLINDLGIGSHPGFLRGLSKIAEAAKEDGFVTGKIEESKGKKSYADRIYADSAKT